MLVTRNEKLNRIIQVCLLLNVYLHARACVRVSVCVYAGVYVCSQVLSLKRLEGRYT